MSDEEHHFESKADAGASKTYPQQAGTIRKNGYIVIKGRPCKVVEVYTSKTGKHGHAKCHFVGIDIFNGKKLEDIVPSSHNCDVPHVNRTNYQLIDISEDGFVSLLTENGNTKDDLRLPTDENLLGQRSSELASQLKEGAGYSMSKNDQESCQVTPENISGTSDSEEVGDGETNVVEKDEYEPDAKRRSTEIRVSEPTASHRTVSEPRIIVQRTSEVDLLDDGYRWRKYGQKVVKGNPYPRMVMKELKGLVHFVCTVEFWRMALLWTVWLLTSYFQLLFQSLVTWKPIPYKRCVPPTIGMQRPVCIVTGATSGLGAAAAYALSREGFHVVLVGRSSHLLSKTVADLMGRNKDACIEAFQVDLSSFQSILKFKETLQQWLSDLDMHSSIQLLINNAGILATSSRLTAEGYDQMMSTNYIGAFYLTKLLLPLLRNSPVPSRIVNVTSFTHRNVFGARVDKETVTGKCFLRSKYYPCAHIYEYSKLCLLIFSYELHRQLGLMDKSCHVSVIAADPGIVKTNIMREVPSFLSLMAFTVLNLLGLLQSPENGINSILDAALAPPETSGVYFFGGKGMTINSSALSYDSKLAGELWTTSCDLFLNSQLAYKDLSN